LFASGADRIQANLAANGELLWSIPLKERGAQQGALALKFLAVPTGSELLFVDTITGRQLLEWDPGRGVTAAPAWKGGELYVLSNSGVLYALNLIDPS
jgi:hypothetical protein